MMSFRIFPKTCRNSRQSTCTRIPSSTLRPPFGFSPTLGIAVHTRAGDRTSVRRCLSVNSNSAAPAQTVNSNYQSTSTSSTTATKAKETPVGSALFGSRSSTALVAISALTVGFSLGSTYQQQQQQQPGAVVGHDHDARHRVLPNGLPRTCCDSADRNNVDATLSSQSSSPSPPTTTRSLTPAQEALPGRLAKIIGSENVLDGRAGKSSTAKLAPFLTGARITHGGSALCVVTPRRLHEVVDCIQAIVDAHCTVLPQGQNTGLTGGSVPRRPAKSAPRTNSTTTTTTTTTTNDDDRPTVVLSLKHLDRIFPIDDGTRVVCLAGVGLASLQTFLATYFPDRESHSTLGSTFLNPTTAAGVALGSGGTQCRKGPAYTERALVVKVSTNKWKEHVVEVVNTLGIKGMEDNTKLTKERARKMDSAAYRLDTWSRWVHEGYERDMRYSIAEQSPENGNDSTEAPQRVAAAAASDVGYAERLCRTEDKDIHSSSSGGVQTKDNDAVSRFNADTRGPDLNRSEGKVVILATVHDTFPKPKATKTFWFGFDSLETALKFRREVCLDNAKDLPVSVEYMDRDAFDVIDRSGRVLGAAIKLLGPSSSTLRHFWNFKLWIEALPMEGASLAVDQFLHFINPSMPTTLPSSIMEIGRTMDHHVALTVGEYGGGTMDRFLDRLQEFAAREGREKIAIHECHGSSDERSLTAFRFVAAPAFRTWCVGEGMQGFSVDYALPKTGGSVPVLPKKFMPLKRMRYSHFACNVVHEDIAYGPEVNVHDAKSALKETVEFECGGKLPAEHGHGTEYEAPASAQERWKRMDPLNVMNPGVGGLSSNFQYRE